MPFNNARAKRIFSWQMIEPWQAGDMSKLGDLPGRHRTPSQPNSKSTEENDCEFRPRSERAYSGWARAKRSPAPSKRRYTAKTVRPPSFPRGLPNGSKVRGCLLCRKTKQAAVFMG